MLKPFIEEALEDLNKRVRVICPNCGEINHICIKKDFCLTALSPYPEVIQGNPYYCCSSCGTWLNQYKAEKFFQGLREILILDTDSRKKDLLESFLED